MTRRKLFLYLASAAGYIGVGMLLGYAFSDQSKNTALWIGILLVLAAAILIGMFISARAERSSNRPVPSTGTTAEQSAKE